MYAFSRVSTIRVPDHPDGGDLLVRVTKRGSSITQLAADVAPAAVITATAPAAAQSSSAAVAAAAGQPAAVITAVPASASAAEAAGGEPPTAAAEAATTTTAAVAGGPAVAEAATRAAAAAEAGRSERASASSATDDDVDVEGFGYNVEGAVIFDGGCYSVGPAYIGPLGDAIAGDSNEGSAAGGRVYGDGGEASELGLGEGEEEEGLEEGEGEEEEEGLVSTAAGAAAAATVMIEQVLTVAGDKRMRLVATLKVAAIPGREVEVEVVRLLLFKEHWAGMTPTPVGAVAVGGVGDESTSTTTASSSSSSVISDGPGRVVQIPGTVRLQGDGQAASTNTSSSSSSSGGGLRLSSSERWDLACIDLPRAQPDQLVGAWQVFTVAAQPVVEMDPDTLTER